MELGAVCVRRRVSTVLCLRVLPPDDMGLGVAPLATTLSLSTLLELLAAAGLSAIGPASLVSSGTSRLYCCCYCCWCFNLNCSYDCVGTSILYPMRLSICGLLWAAQRITSSVKIAL